MLPSTASRALSAAPAQVAVPAFVPLRVEVSCFVTDGVRRANLIQALGAIDGLADAARVAEATVEKWRRDMIGDKGN
jgi:hypothetical protein